MKYQLNTTNYCDFSTFAVNKLPARSYFIPYPVRAAADTVAPKQKRYASPKVQCLNGEWDFKFYPRPAELPTAFDTDAVQFDKLDVPSCWQFRGYDRPFYVNIRYQFPYKPPVIPTTGKVGRVFSWLGCDTGIRPRWKDPGEEYNFVGVYRRFVDVVDTDKRRVISFLGVASCMDLYVNGFFIGYSEGAHNTAEFDLTGKLKTGQNELVVVVHRWCNGTYLEGQDMFRNNGIFRDVLLRTEEPTDLWDIDAKTEKTADGYALTMTAEMLSDTDVTFTVRGHGLELTQTVRAENGKAQAVFNCPGVTEWNAEAPTLYDMYYETATSCVKEHIGFRTVEIKGDVFLLNGQKVKLKGVNHHDTDAKNGYTMSPDDIERDLLVCKRFNIDTVRTSHYPPDPLLLELADELGIYLVDENDLETHGTFAMQLPPTYNSISNDPKWESHYMDRITRLYQRDKIHGNTSVIMWSLGNEAGGYHNTDAMYAYLKQHSPLPVHYESAVHCKRQAYDVGSEMYPSVQMVHDVGEKRRKQTRLNDRPYFMCEYAHAMGVGPGNTEAYWQEIYKYDSLMGGCVWEMVDHAVLHDDGSYTYGGDHGEWEHDRNFCVDGLFYPDRTPSTGAKLMRFIYRPIRVAHLGGEQFEIFNTTAFSIGRYNLAFRWNDGSETILTPQTAPLTKGTVTVPLGSAVDGLLAVTVEATDTVTGQAVSEEQLVLAQTVAPAPAVKPLPGDATVESGRLVCRRGGAVLLAGADEGTLLYRAPTDNDVDFMFRNLMTPYAHQSEEIVSSQAVADGWQVVTKLRNRRGSCTVTDTYQGTDRGVLVTSVLHHEFGTREIPRFGKCFRLDALFDAVHYVGRCGESYCDMKDQFPIRAVDCTVADMTEPNLCPQESGNRMDCTLASVSDSKTRIVFEAVDKPFELAVKPYTDRALLDMKHRGDEARTGTYVTIQAFQQGIGTGACGPGVMPEFKYTLKEDCTLKFLVRVEQV